MSNKATICSSLQKKCFGFIIHHQLLIQAKGVIIRTAKSTYIRKKERKPL